MKKNSIKFLLISVLAIVPGVAFAASTDVKSLAASVTTIIYYFIPLLFGLALAAFFWGMVKYLLSAGGDEKALAEGKKIMVYGIVALAVMASVWGIVEIVGNTFFGTNILKGSAQQLNLGSSPSSPSSSGNSLF